MIFNSDLGDQLKKASARYNISGLIRSLAIISRAEYDLMTNKNLLFLLERSLLELRRSAKL